MGFLEQLITVIATLLGIGGIGGNLSADKVPAELVADMQVAQAKDNKEVAQLEMQKANLAYQQALNEQKLIDAKRK
jgi:hypothetical protein